MTNKPKVDHKVAWLQLNRQEVGVEIKFRPSRLAGGFALGRSMVA
jgi:hypothetical protein